jgi:DNA-binding NarL/FixJ family response regulator
MAAGALLAAATIKVRSRLHRISLDANDCRQIITDLRRSRGASLRTLGPLAGAYRRQQVSFHHHRTWQDCLHHCPDHVPRGAVYARPIIAARVLSEFHLSMPEQPGIEPLTESEMAILRLVAQGVENEHIAQALNYAVYTVANRLRTIHEKLHVTNRTQAALYALR